MIKLLRAVSPLVTYPKLLPARLNYALALIIVITTVSVILDGLALALVVPLIDLLIGTEDDTSSVTIIRWTSDLLGAVGIETTTGWLIATIIVFQVARAVGLALQVWLTTHYRAEFERHLKDSIVFGATIP